MSNVGRGMFSYIPDSSMIGTVFCNFIANAMYRPPAREIIPSSRAANSFHRCVAYSAIDVQLELQGADWDSSDIACKSQSNYSTPAASGGADSSSHKKITFTVAGLQVCGCSCRSLLRPLILTRLCPLVRPAQALSLFKTALHFRIIFHTRSCYC